MGNFLIKLSKGLGRSLLWLGAALFFVIIVLQISLWFGLQWLNSDKGEAWTKQQIKIVLKDTDYRVEYTGFRYRPLTSLNVQNLRVFNNEEILVSAENTKIGVDILPLVLRELSLNFVSDKVVIHSLPVAEENDAKKAKGLYLKEFSLPNLYFDKFNISKVLINHFEISETILGQKVTLSPLLKGDISIDEVSKIAFDLSLNTDVNNISVVPFLPQTILLDGRFDTKTALLELSRLLIKSDVYQLTSQASTIFREGEEVESQTEIVSQDLSQFSEAINGNLKAVLNVSGKQENLVADASGMVTMPILEERGLKPVSFKVQSNYKKVGGLQPTMVTISSSYKDIPIELTSLLEQKGSVVVANDIVGTAPDVKLSGNISYDLENFIAIGKLSADVAKISTYKDLLQLDIEGQLKANVDLSKSELGQKAEFKVDGQDFKYQNVKLKNLKLLAIFPTVENYWPTKADWTLNGLEVSGADIQTISGSITKNKDNIFVLSTKGAGTYQIPFLFNFKTDLIGLENNKPKAQNINASIKLKSQPFKITGSLDANNIDVLIKTNALSLTDISDEIPDALKKIKINGAAKISGPMASPIIDSDISLSAFSVSKKTPEIKIDLDAGYSNKMATLNMDGTGKGIKNLSANVKTPLTLSLNPFVFYFPTSQSLNGKANLDLEIEELANIFLPPQYDLSGLFQSNINIGATVQNPSVQGNIKLSNSKFSDEDLGVYLRDINAQGDLTNTRFTLNNLSANDNEKGSIKASGYVNLNSFMPHDVQMSLNMKNFHLLDSDLADGLFNADLTLLGNQKQYNVTGSVRPNYIDITIPEKLHTNIPELNIVVDEDKSPTKNLMSAIKLNIQFIADNKIFVRGWGLDAEFGGKLKIDGNLGDPNFDGVLKSSRGRYTEFGKRFELTRANLNFLGRIPANPIMDIVAETKVEDILAQVNLKGTIQKPKISFSSSPALPEDEVLARILFGRDLSSISPFQAVQLAQTIRRFSGKGGSGFDPLGKIRETTGLDDLRVDTDEEGETTVGAGKYISDKVYLEFEKGSGENSGAANLEVEVTPNIKLESQVGQDAQAGAGLFWEWDY